MTIRTRICLGLLLLLPLAVYWQTIFHEYGFRDDYSLPREVHEEPGKVMRLTASNGRPVYGFLLHASLGPAVAKIANLQWVRLTGLAFLTAVGAALWWQLRRSGWSEIDATVAGLAITLLPAAQVTAAWAIAWPIAVGLLLAVAGFAAVEGALARTGWRRIAAAAGGSVCYVLAGLTYQPSAMFAIVPLAGALMLRTSPTAANQIRWTTIHLAALFVSLVAGFLFMNLLFSQGVFPEAGRMNLEPHPFIKMIWFFRQPLANALALFALRDHFDVGWLAFWSAAAIVTVTLALGFWFDIRRTPAQKAKWLVCVLFLPFVAHSVSLAANQTAIGYRTLFPLAGLVVVLLVFSLRSLRVAGLLKPAAHRATLALMILVAAVCANRNAFTLIAQPQNREWLLVRNAVDRLPLKPDASVYFIAPEFDDRSTERVFADEFGTLSSDSDWSRKELFQTALRERFPEGLPAGATYALSIGYEAPNAGAYDLVIDLRKLREYRGL